MAVIVRISMAILDRIIRHNHFSVRKWFSLIALASAGTAASAHAQRYPGHHPGNVENGGNSYNGNPKYGNYAAYGEFDPERAMKVRRIHGILAAVAMIVLFPSGSILMRVIPGPLAIWVHGMTQLVAFVLFTAAAAMGLGLVQEVDRVGISLWVRENTNYHLYIGLVVFICLMIQPALGVIHHERFKQLRRRQVWSYLHLFNGRIFITLGIINGALGLWIARESIIWKVVYLLVAAAIWSLWLAVAMWGEWRRWRERRFPAGFRPDRRRATGTTW
ncbi:uncharacterized protein B0T15DRAFT_539360 [Chaetomium strumarium]|uniref:Cytochrome b561 domain-containing protein n=1 Tax=Chaetomium strumarium TaxID=1170767 RepID=A0AAJ0LZ73_9PEZI|nr:hypothetical protein B0T15DRAFT_539360 [Chaetomium strumarium]